MIEVRFTGSATEIRGEMAQLLGDSKVVALTPPTGTAKTAQSEEPKKAAKKEAEPAQATQASSAAPSLESAKVLVVDLIKKITKDGYLKFFAENFAPHTKLTELNAEQLAVFVSKAQEALK